MDNIKIALMKTGVQGMTWAGVAQVHVQW